MGKEPRNLPDDPKEGRTVEREDLKRELSEEGFDEEGRPRDPARGDARIPTPPPPD